MKNYSDTIKQVAIFEEINEPDLQELLKCLSAKYVHYKKNQFIFINGESVVEVGIVLSGEVQIIKEDYYGNKNIISKITDGGMFGEAFACAGIKNLPVSVLASADCDILMLKFTNIVTPCSKACAFHNKLISNMLSIFATKNIMLNQKIEFTSKRTTREKLLSYLFAQALKNKGNSFNIPFNRQELADYLSINRSAMSSELCKLRDDGILEFNKNKFKLF